MHPLLCACGWKQNRKKHEGKDARRIWAFSPSLFNQRKKTDMSNHNKTSAGKWAFAITVSQPPLERAPFLDINQHFMNWFFHSLFNYSYFFIYITTEDFFLMRLNHLFHISQSHFKFFFIFFFILFGNNFVPLFCLGWKKAEREEQHWSYHRLQHLMGAQRKVVKAECHFSIDQLWM